MTIGVGVLGTSMEGRGRGTFPDHVVLVCDTMGSFGDEYSHPRLHKSFHLPHNKWYAVAADQVDRAAELVPLLDFHIGKVAIETRTYGDIVRAVSTACFLYKGNKFTQLVLPKLRMPPEVFDPRQCDPQTNATLQAEWEKFTIGCDLLIGAFDHNGQAYLIDVNGAEGTAQGVNMPGYWAIGTGSGNAMYWLSHRGHTLGMTPVRALYHAYEAKMMAADAPNVNEHLDILVANAEAHWWCTSHTTKSEQSTVPEFPISSLEKLFTEYGPKPTDALDEMKVDLIKKKSGAAGSGIQ